MQLSIWEQETFYAPQDVVIIGSGFTGLWSAYYLKKKHPKLKITVLERGCIPTGASTRNAGFACFGSLSEVVHDAKTMGKDKMLELVEMRHRGLEKIQKHFSASLIDFDLCGGYELYDENDTASSAQLEENMSYINSLLRPITKKKRTYALADDALASFGFGRTRHMVKNELEGYLHSGKLLQALLFKIQGMGVQVLSHVNVSGWVQDGTSFAIHTTLPAPLNAGRLLICTNAFAKDFLPQESIVPARGQVLLTSPVQGLPWKGTFHSDEGFYYFRNLGDRVLLGGARNQAFKEEETTTMDTSPFIQTVLEQYLEEVVLPGFKGRYTISHRWAGIMAMGAEKLPIVKQVQPNVFCAVRMSGMGVALAPVTGQQVASLMFE